MHVMIIIPRYDKIKYIINVLLPASILMSTVPSWLIRYIMLVVRGQGFYTSPSLSEISLNSNGHYVQCSSLLLPAGEAAWQHIIHV